MEAWLQFAGSVVVAILALVGVIITNRKSNNEMIGQMEKAQAVTDTKLENLTAEVQKHNNFASKIPAIEQRVIHLEEDVKELKQAKGKA